MKLYNLIYASTCTEKISFDEVKKLADKALIKNKEMKVTGILFYSNNYFIQYLEGSQSKINTLYNTISKDPRHKDLTLLSYNLLAERKFPNWKMGSFEIPNHPGIKKIFNDIFHGFDFNPYLLKPEKSLEVINSISSLVNKDSNLIH